jgi:hypothetical protein
VLDDFTRYLQVFTIQSKSDVADCLDSAFLTLKTMFCPQYHSCVLRSDYGTKFVNSKVEEILKQYELQYDNSKPYDHEHIRIAERINRTIEERI